MNPEANKALIYEMADTLLRNWWTLVAAVGFGLAGSLLVLSQTPRIYEASATILISPQSIPKEFFQTTVTEDMTRRMMALEEAVISERYMVQLIDRIYGPQENEDKLHSLMRSVRNRVTVRPTADLKLGWLSFELTFRDAEPYRAASVVNTLAQLYIEQNTDFRTGQAQETTRTVEERLSQAKLDFEDVDRRFNEFNAEHSFETETHLNANLRLLETAKRDLESTQHQRSLNQERQSDQRAQLEALSAVTTTAETIATLEQELESLLVSYSDVHPAVIRKRRQIEELRASAAANPTEEVTLDLTDPQVSKLQAQLNALELEATTLEANEGRFRRLIREYERRIQAVPEVQPQLTALLNEHKVLRERYQDLQGKADRARESQFLEENRKGGRLELAERAERPPGPVYPNPKRFHAIGLVLGLTVFVGPLLVWRLLHPRIASEVGLRALTPVPVLVSIPRVTTPANRGLPARRFVRNLVLSMAGVAALVVVRVIL